MYDPDTAKDTLEDIEEERRDHLENKARERNCNPDTPNLSVGDMNITANNFDKIKKENEVFILGISDIQCDTCCFTEGILDMIYSEL
jgi:hypothetical protein